MADSLAAAWPALLTLCQPMWRRHSVLTTGWKPPAKLLIPTCLSAIPTSLFPAGPR
jgi:hypothetical protein